MSFHARKILFESVQVSTSHCKMFMGWEGAHFFVDRVYTHYSQAQHDSKVPAVTRWQMIGNSGMKLK